MTRQSGSYAQIQQWLFQRYGFRPIASWITHCKELYNLPVKPNPNGYRPCERMCPPEKQPMVREAFEHFGLLPKKHASIR